MKGTKDTRIFCMGIHNILNVRGYQISGQSKLFCHFISEHLDILLLIQFMHVNRSKFDLPQPVLPLYVMCIVIPRHRLS